MASLHGGTPSGAGVLLDHPNWRQDLSEDPTQMDFSHTTTYTEYYVRELGLPSSLVPGKQPLEAYARRRNGRGDRHRTGLVPDVQGGQRSRYDKAGNPVMRLRALRTTHPPPPPSLHPSPWGRALARNSTGHLSPTRSGQRARPVRADCGSHMMMLLGDQWRGQNLTATHPWRRSGRENGKAPILNHVQPSMRWVVGVGSGGRG